MELVDLSEFERLWTAADEKEEHGDGPGAAQLYKLALDKVGVDFQALPPNKAREWMKVIVRSAGY